MTGRRRQLGWAAAALVLFLRPAHAQDAVQDSAREALRRATVFLRSVAVHGGYAGIYEADLSRRYSESLDLPIAPTKVWIQPPGTPAVGEVFLWAYRVSHEPVYLAAARDVGQCLAWTQGESGGWGYVGDTAGFRADLIDAPRGRGPCTLDDDTTQVAVRCLMRLDQVLDEPWLSDAVQRGLDYLLRSQFPNGAWPQWYPLRGDYHDCYTFNDKVINTCMSVLLEAYHIYGDEKFLRSAERGGDFIVASQLSPPQSGWAEQYSHDMKPAWGRDFEPPMVCSVATARNMETLLELFLETGQEKYLDPIAPAANWLRHSMLPGDRWARFYDPETNRPVYCDTGRRIRFTRKEISDKLRDSYAWEGTFGAAAAIQRHEKLRRLGPKTFRAKELEPNVPSAADIRRRKIRVEKITNQQDERGRWTRGDKLYMGDFVTNMNMLCQYLEGDRSGAP